MLVVAILKPDVDLLSELVLSPDCLFEGEYDASFFIPGIFFMNRLYDLNGNQITTAKQYINRVL